MIIMSADIKGKRFISLDDYIALLNDTMKALEIASDVDPGWIRSMTTIEVQLSSLKEIRDRKI